MLGFFRYSLLHRRLTALLALLSLLTPLATGLLHHPAAQPFFASICHLTMTQNQAPSHHPIQKTPPQKAPTCPICQSLNLLGSGSSAPPTLPFLPLFFAILLCGFLQRNQYQVKFTPAPQARPRAPPVFVAA